MLELTQYMTEQPVSVLPYGTSYVICNTFFSALAGYGLHMLVTGPGCGGVGTAGALQRDILN